jgi:predicted phage baseplate assembly protein
MALARISYTNKTYEEIRDALIKRIPIIAGDKWTDFNTSDVGVTLLELYCGIADLLLYYLDHQANEAYLSTAAERKNIINLTRLIGYKLESLSAASASVTFSIGSTHTRNIVIPKYTRLKGANNLDYVTINDCTITSGETSVVVQAKQGTFYEETHTSDGIAYQNIQLDSDSIAENTIYVYVGAGETLWSEEETLINSYENDEVYTREIDEDNYQTVYFGDNVNGEIPEGTIKIQYIITSGELGNIGTGLVNKVVDPIYDVNGTEVTVTVVNSESFTGGSAVESIDEARVQAPAELATQDRAVTIEDFETLLNGYPGVLKSQAVDVRSSLTMPFKYIELYVIPETNMEAVPEPQISSVLEEELTSYLDDKIIAGRLFAFKNVTYVSVDVNMVIYVYSNYDRNSVKTAVGNKLEEIFDVENVEIGQSLRYSQLAAELQSVDGIAYVDLLTPTSNMEVTYGEILTLGTTTITLGEVQST